MILKPYAISTSSFTHEVCQDGEHAGTHIFMAEASDLRGLRLERVYDDACDVGFTLVSAKTGNTVVMVVSGETRDREGELVSTNFVPAPGQGQVPPIKVLVFND